MIRDIQNGDDSGFSIIAEAYRPLLVSLVTDEFSDRSLYKDAGYDDLMQEAAIALYSAAMAYDLNQSSVTFGLYAKICVKNRMISIRRKMISKRRKQIAAVKEKKTNNTGLAEARMSRHMQIDAATLSEMAEKTLSKLEKEVFALYAQEMSYKEIAEYLDISVKSVDNAIYRIKSKLKKQF